MNKIDWKFNIIDTSSKHTTLRRLYDLIKLVGVDKIVSIGVYNREDELNALLDNNDDLQKLINQIKIEAKHSSTKYIKVVAEN